LKRKAEMIRLLTSDPMMSDWLRQIRHISPIRTLAARKNRK